MKKKFTTLVIEDEEFSRNGLFELLKKYNKIELIGSASNGKEAVKKINELKPDLIFLDIQMPVLNGFEVLRRVEHMPLVIFTTAFDEFALKAFETNSIDYLLKPIEEERLEITLKKLEKITSSYHEENSSNENLMSKIKTLLKEVDAKGEEKEKIKRFHVKIGDEVIFIEMDKIYYFKSDKKYTILKTYDNEYVISESLSYLDDNLPDNFVRVHRAYIININHMKKLKRWFAGKYNAEMKDKENSTVPVSKNYRENLFT